VNKRHFSLKPCLKYPITKPAVRSTANHREASLMREKSGRSDSGLLREILGEYQIILSHKIIFLRKIATYEGSIDCGLLTKETRS
jgi:hypothetical protein